jgi:hypothetical protein
MREQELANRQLDELATLLNDGWDLLHALPLGAAGGVGAIGPASGPREAFTFANWAAIVILERAG